MSIWEPGRKASTPSRSTTMPPLMRRVSRPFTVEPPSWASLMLSQTRMKSAFCLERTTRPSRSSTFSRNTSTSAPISIDSGASPNSFSGMAPSDLKPMSTRTSPGVVPTTRPLTISPSLMPEKLSSYMAIRSSNCSCEYSGVSRSSMLISPYTGFSSTAVAVSEESSGVSTWGISASGDCSVI